MEPVPSTQVPLGGMSLDEDTRWLEWVTKQFESIAGEDKEIDLDEFKTALKVKESFFAERFFTLFDSDGSNSISLDELLKALNLLIHGSETDKLRFLFQVYDVDGSGSIDPDELRTVLKSCLKESAISLPEEKLDDLTLALFESADKDNSGSITFEELKAELETFPEVMENLTISAANWLKPPDLDQKKRPTPRYLTRTYWHNNSRKLLFLCLYSVLNLLLFIMNMMQYAYGGPWLMLAKGCGICLNLNCTFIMVLMLRRCLTWLRATWIVRILPLDQNILLHQMVGYAIVIFTVAHTMAHVMNFITLTQADDSYQLWEYLLTTRPGIGWVKGTASITGVVLQVLICLMVVCSSTFVRRSGHFEVFYWSHLLYIWVWVLLIVHCANFWKWFVAPGVIFFVEKLVGIAVSRMGGLYIVEVNLLPSKVTHLVIKRPPFFQFKPGDYVYINIPVIAKYEWHPFTISSAPEQQDTMWLHVRSMGQWTNRLFEYFRQSDSQAMSNKRLTASLRNRRHETRNQEDLFKNMNDNGTVASNEDVAVELTLYRVNRARCASEKPHVDPTVQAELGEAPSATREICAKLSENHRYCNIKCYVDGPYGTPTRQIFASEHAVLIGAGIGITPFASILQSIMYRYRMRKQNCPNCNYSWCETIKDNEMKLRKVDFIWINRDQKSFEWFVSLLTKLEMDQADEEPEGRFLEMHMYMTSALSKNDMKAIGLQMALDLLAKKEKRDSITGLRTRTQPGRPDWGKVFKKVSEEKKGKVHVFYCGSPALAKVIKAQSEKFGFNFYKENF
ncbi:NADPH oxidase 5 [Astyanax mexicanus]|uniref:NADPH oxidase 5 n=1 Tax=Astyanax mexicanus TaxID=7994 RepID=A0A8T2MBU0_ASTMX|nr:NADPH oxidase 5 [Astyanax mexicanus]